MSEPDPGAPGASYMRWSGRKQAGAISMAVGALVAAGVGSQLLFQPTVGRGGCDADNSGYGYQASTGYSGYGSGDDGCDPVGTFIPVTPTRLLDGRIAPQVLLGANGTTDVQVTGVAGVPASGVAAVVLNLTVDQPTAMSFFKLFPAGGSTSTSSLNFNVGQTRAAETTVKVGAGGKVTILNNVGTAFPIVDIQGYYATAVSPVTGSSYVPLLAPTRAFDTRLAATGPFSRLNPNETRSFPLSGLPSGTTAVVANFTGVRPTGTGFLTVYPDLTPLPLVSNLNFTPLRTIPNLATIPLGTNSSIAVLNGSPGTIDVLIDIAGYFVSRSSSEVGDRFTPVDPARIGDTRASEGNIGGLTTFTAPGQQKFLKVTGVGGVPANNVSAVVVSLTAARITPPETFITAFPYLSPTPLVSNLNPIAGEDAANLAIVRVGVAGFITLLNNVPNADLVVDVYGYFLSA